MGGRAAEELVFGLPTTGASADIEQATKIARAMVTEYGMTPALGPVKYGEEQGDPFVGRGGSGSLDYSPEVAAIIDEQVRNLINKAHDEAYTILKENRDTLDRLAEKLLEKETLRRADLEVIFTDVVQRERLNFFDTDPKHPADGREPVKTPVELAIERGEEPPKKVNIFAPVREENPEDSADSTAEPANGRALPSGGFGSSSNDSDAARAFNYGGTPPPKDWTVPGWPTNQDKRNEQGNRGQHPGAANYPVNPDSGHIPSADAKGRNDSARSNAQQSPSNNEQAWSQAQADKWTQPAGQSENNAPDQTGRHRRIIGEDSDSTPTTIVPVMPKSSGEGSVGKPQRGGQSESKQDESNNEEPQLRGFRLPENEQPDHKDD